MPDQLQDAVIVAAEVLGDVTIARLVVEALTRSRAASRAIALEAIQRGVWDRPG